jgi:hypothetical protein
VQGGGPMLAPRTRFFARLRHAVVNGRAARRIEALADPVDRKEAR